MTTTLNTDLPEEVDAAILVDIQGDFLEGGALAVPNGNEVIDPSVELTEHVQFTVATFDEHDENHCSFIHRGGIWISHAVKGTLGSKLQARIKAVADLAVAKGTNINEEAYSGFQGTKLAQWLRARGVTRVVITGLATDYCVKATALDAVKEGFKVIVIIDAIRGVEVNAGDCARALEELEQAGVQLCTLADFIATKVGA